MSPKRSQLFVGLILSFLVLFAFQNCGGDWSAKIGGSGEPYEGTKPTDPGEPIPSGPGRINCEIEDSEIGPVTAASHLDRRNPAWMIGFKSDGKPKRIRVPYNAKKPLKIVMGNIGKLMDLQFGGQPAELTLTIQLGVGDQQAPAETITIELPCK
jgi:hypothetical protein